MTARRPRSSPRTAPSTGSAGPASNSGACFAALLGDANNGRWRIAPAAAGADANARLRRRYRRNTLILETEFTTADGSGAVVLIDFMPLRGGRAGSHLVRLVVGKRGTVPMRTELIVRFGYGGWAPWVTRSETGDLLAIAGPDMLHPPHAGRASGRAADHGRRLRRVGRAAGAVRSHVRPIPLATSRASGCRRRAAVHGRILAVVGERLPEPRTARRDHYSLADHVEGSDLCADGGHRRRADHLAARATGRAAQLGLPLLLAARRYADAPGADEHGILRRGEGVARLAAPSRRRKPGGYPNHVRGAGERWLAEREVPWLGGYENSKPVRIGNAAADQLQLDVFGEVMDAAHHARIGGLQDLAAAWEFQRALLAHLETVWRAPDEGIWEVRSGRHHFTYSKVMAWVAFDRGIKAVEAFGLDGPVDRWRRIRAEIHEEVCRRAFNTDLGSFAQKYDSDLLDASALLIPQVGFLPPDDPRVQGTVEAIERKLLHGGFVLRYDTAATEDGLPPGEGAFLPCSFWLADAYVLIGRRATRSACLSGWSACATTSACSRRNTTLALSVWLATSPRHSPILRSSTRRTISPVRRSHASSVPETRGSR